MSFENSSEYMSWINSEALMEIIEFCKNNMAKFKIPKKIIFGNIEKTPAGKTQKFLLRKKANEK